MHICPSNVVASVLDRLTTRWLRNDGVPGTVWLGGEWLDDASLACDLGDVAPFVFCCGDRPRALRLCEDAIRSVNERPIEGADVPFANHDLVLGLIEVGRLADRADLVDAAASILTVLVSEYQHRGFLLSNRSSASMPPVSKAFAVGYVELAVELAELGRGPHWLDAARDWLQAWTSTSTFKRRGLFRHYEYPHAPPLGALRTLVTNRPTIHFFKDNSNALFGLLRYFQATAMGSDWIELACRGFRSLISPEGHVAQCVDRSQPRWSLMTAAPAIELCIALHHAGLSGGWLECAAQIAEAALARRWPNGAIPASDDSIGDHLDHTTDFIVSLFFLSAATEKSCWAAAANDLLTDQIKLHYSSEGLVLSVDAHGDVRDPRIFIKYQTLWLKGFLASRLEELDTNSAAVLRDR
jgi:hypothetical protein